MSETPDLVQPAPPTGSASRNRWKWVAALLAIAVVGLIVAACGWRRYQYPYGYSHRCILIIGLGLSSYAEEHGGVFPSGGTTPEASLSKLAADDVVPIGVLCGKTLSEKKAEAAFKRDGALGPDTCDWHYVEGLGEADDPRIAVVWDKVGLGHNGQRLRSGGHEVVFVDGSRSFITGAEWPGFLEEQAKLLADRTDDVRKGIPALEALVRFPSGQIVSNELAGGYVLETRNRLGSSSQSGSTSLRRWRFDSEKGPATLTLKLPDQHLHSKPVSVEVNKGRAQPREIVFELEPD